MIFEDVITRHATLEDVSGIVALKQSLSFQSMQGTVGGGFVLGSSPERYKQFIQSGGVLVAEQRGRIIAYTTTFDDYAFRSSDIWTRRGRVNWVHDFDPSAIEHDTIGYLDQLAVAADWRKRYLGALIAIYATHQLIRGGHQHILTTTLLEPIENRAAVPLIEHVGGRCVGEAIEHYDGIGPVRSAIFYMSARDIVETIAHKQTHGSPREQTLIAFWQRIMAT